ncbi:MAG: flagellar hook-associated protein FlgK [Myxococcaceae bacterium]
MSLFSVLSTAASGLTAATAESGTAGHNIDNANTPGYARQTVDLAATLPMDMLGGRYLGRGVDIQQVSQARDRFAEAQLPGAFAHASGSQAQAESLQGLSALDPNNPLSGSLGDFYSALRALAQNPGDLPLRTAAVTQAQQLTRNFSATRQQIVDARSGLDTQVSGVLPEVNQTAAQLAQLNTQIRIAAATGGSPNDLLDARQKLSDKLSQLTGATLVASGNGDFNLVMSDGSALVQGDKSATLSAVPNAANEGHLKLQLTRLDGSGPVDVGTLSGGQLGGWLAARDGAFATAENRVDQLAYDFANAVNATHSAGFALDGSTGRNLFSVSATVQGAASSLSVDAAIAADPSLLAAAATAAGAPGDNTNLLATIATQTQSLSGGLDAESTLGDISAQFGATAEKMQAASESDAGVRDHLLSLRDAASGVSIDEEMVNLTKAQRAYEATTKVIQTADEMLQTLMNLK